METAKEQEWRKKRKTMWRKKSAAWWEWRTGKMAEAGWRKRGSSPL
jgi:hypothetical protein